MKDICLLPKGAELFKSEVEIATVVSRVATEVKKAYEGLEHDLVPVCIMFGSIPFYTDLMRVLQIPALNLQYMEVSSYKGGRESSGNVRILHDLSVSVAGRHVLIVEDIVDTGFTMQALIRHFESKGPVSVRVCSLLNKPDRRRVEVPIDFKGFDIPDRFVVGYGLDDDGKYRGLPSLFFLE